VDAPTPITARRAPLHRRLARVCALGLVAALLPLAVLASLTSMKATQVVRQEVAARLGVTASLSAALVSAQLTTAVDVVEASARRPRMVAAVADGDPAHFDLRELRQQLVAMRAARSSLASTAVLDLDGIVRQSPAVPASVGVDVSGRAYFRGLAATGSTYISDAFVAVTAGRPLIVAIATYIRAPSLPGGPPGRPLAVLVAGVDRTEVQTVVDSVARDQGVGLWVADRANHLLAAPGAGVSGVRPVSATEVGPAQRARPGHLVDLAAARPALLVVRQTVLLPGWTVFAALPRAETYAGAASIRRTVLGIATPLALVVLGGIVVLLRTQRRQWLAEAALEVARDEAHAASQQKSAFLANMSHELRTPLNAILGFGQLLALDRLDAAQREGVHHIVQAGQHLLGLVDEVLDIAKMERGGIRLSLEPVSLPAVLDGTLAMIAPLAERERITIHLEGPPAECYVRADNQRLRQVTMNLLSNAVKYNATGGQVLVRCGTPTDGTVRLEITDTGPGIDPADVPRLFRPFERLAAGDSHVEGTGLGLALSRHLVTAMGGRIGVESEPGVGSTFWIELPLADAPVPEPLPERDPEPEPGHGAGPGTVLYVEDNLSNVRLLERVLQRRPQLRMLVAMLGTLALDMAREHRPDLVLLDLHLPDLSGEHVLRSLRSDPRTAALPIVMLSADATSGQRARLIAQGATAYLTKPFDVTKLLDVLDRWAVAPLGTDRPAGKGPGAAPSSRPEADVVVLPDDSVADPRLPGYVHDVVNLLGITQTYCSLLKGSARTEADLAALDEISVVTREAVALSRGLLRNDGSSG
jgi:signal transduction histidine kinase/ActR/RegA family two-component response regulator